METDIATDPVLGRFRHAPHELYGDRLDRVPPFGSRAAMRETIRIVMSRHSLRRFPTVGWR
jgi:hypothetical protein